MSLAFEGGYTKNVFDNTGHDNDTHEGFGYGGQVNFGYSFARPKSMGYMLTIGLGFSNVPEEDNQNKFSKITIDILSEFNLLYGLNSSVYWLFGFNIKNSLIGILDNDDDIVRVSGVGIGLQTGVGFSFTKNVGVFLKTAYDTNLFANKEIKSVSKLNGILGLQFTF